MPILSRFLQLFVAAVFVAITAAWLVGGKGVSFTDWLMVTLGLLAALGLHVAPSPATRDRRNSDRGGV